MTLPETALNPWPVIWVRNASIPRVPVSGMSTNSDHVVSPLIRNGVPSFLRRWRPSDEIVSGKMDGGGFGIGSAGAPEPLASCAARTGLRAAGQTGSHDGSDGIGFGATGPTMPPVISGARGRGMASG